MRVLDPRDGHRWAHVVAETVERVARESVARGAEQKRLCKIRGRERGARCVRELFATHPVATPTDARVELTEEIVVEDVRVDEAHFLGHDESSDEAQEMREEGVVELCIGAFERSGDRFRAVVERGDLRSKMDRRRSLGRKRLTGFAFAFFFSLRRALCCFFLRWRRPISFLQRAVFALRSNAGTL